MGNLVLQLGRILFCVLSLGEESMERSLAEELSVFK